MRGISSARMVDVVVAAGPGAAGVALLAATMAADEAVGDQEVRPDFLDGATPESIRCFATEFIGP